MMPKDFYVVLGINRDADLKKIKSAYRKIAKECHPDKSSSTENCEKFINAKEAYETLSNSQKRKQYNFLLDQRRQYPVTDSQKVEEIIPNRRKTADWMTTRPPVIDQFFRGFFQGIFTRHFSRHKDLYLDLILTPSEAARGGVFQLQVPVTEPCSTCQDFGYIENYFCPSCAGFGRIRGNCKVGLGLPANVPHGKDVSLSLEDLGVPDIYLHIRILIGNYF